jgi:hypothetical protein
VDPNGPVSGADGSIAKPYRTIALANVAAFVLGPTASDPVVLRLSPGLWNEVVTLVSNVYVTGDPQAVTLTEAVVWDLSVGINSVFLNAGETMMLSGLVLSGTFTVSNLANKVTHVPSTLSVYDVEFQDTATLTSRPDGRGFPLRATFSGESVLIHAPFNMTNGQLTALTTQFLSDVTFAAGASVTIVSSIMTRGRWTVDESSVSLVGTSVIGERFVFSGASAVTAYASNFFVPNGTIEAGSTFDARTSLISPSENTIFGPGGFDRSTVVLQPVYTGTTTQVVPISPPFISSTSYTVSFMQYATTPTATPFLVSARTPSGFQLYTPGGNVTVAVTITLLD